ncbi:MAG: VWA domain-containing protein [Pirellulaceae bacterium]|nr:VWA domain-containing protein [Pirellulaceae bacterium]
MSETSLPPNVLTTRGAARRHPGRRRGAVILLFAAFLTVCVAVLALAIDLGMVASVQTDLQRSADAAALAGARDLIHGVENAVASAEEYAQLNHAGTHRLSDSEVQVEVGHWNKTSLVFQRDVTPLDAIKVIAQRQNAPFFFGKALGRDNYSTQADAIATAQPRDIMLVLDISGSMENEDKINQLKRSVNLFCSELQRQQGGDRVGVAVYSTTASLLSPLSSDISQVNSLVQSIQEDGSTNISAGMTTGRVEIEDNGRGGAGRLMVVLTDGLVNQPESAAVGRPLVIQEAQLAADDKLPILTISFGSASDPVLMSEVAEIAGGVHFHVSGDSFASQEEELRAVFLKVAANRPLQLVE